MAKQTGLLTFTGKLGNLIGYRRDGNYFLRSMPQVVRQTVATRKASRNFGIASRKAKLIRQGLLPLLNIHPGGSLVNRLNKALIQNEPQQLEGFRWNRHTGITHFFTRSPEYSAAGMLDIPAQTLAPAGGATHIRVRAVAVRISFVERKIIRRNTSEITIALNKPFDGATLPINAPGKGTLLIVLEVQAYKDGVAVNDRRFVAADMIAVVMPAIKKKRVVKSTALPAINKVLDYPLPAAPHKQPRSQAKRQRE